jgi:hypothetical protein
MLSKTTGIFSCNSFNNSFISDLICGCAPPDVLSLNICLHSLILAVTTISVLVELGKTVLAFCGVQPSFIIL